MTTRITKPKGHTPQLSLLLLLLPSFNRACQKINKLYKIKRKYMEMLVVVKHELLIRNLDRVGVNGISKAYGVHSVRGRKLLTYHLNILVVAKAMEKVEAKQKGKGFSYIITPYGDSLLKQLEVAMYKHYLDVSEYNRVKPKLLYFEEIFTHLKKTQV